MTSVARGTSSATDLVGHHGMALFGKKNPKWYPCVVKMDNKDGTIKVQWDDDKKYTKHLPVEKFCMDAEPDDEPVDVPVDVLFGKTEENGDY